MHRSVAFVFVSLAVCGAAHASFDLSLIPQFGAGRVQRFDPVSGVGLGSFSAPLGQHVTLNQGVREAYVGVNNTTRFRRYSYETGDFLGTLEFGVFTSMFDYNAVTNSIFGLTPTGGVRRMNVATGTTNDLTATAGFTFRTLMTAGNAVVAIGVNASNLVVTQSWNASTLTTTDSLITGYGVLPGTRMGKAFLGTRSASTYFYGAAFVGNAGDMRMITGEASLTGFLNSISANPVTGFGTSVIPSVMPAHSGYFLLGQDGVSSTTLRVNGYSFSSDLVSTATATGYTFADSAFGAANVVAPEPGSLLALALGGLALTRRRR